MYIVYFQNSMADFVHHMEPDKYQNYNSIQSNNSPEQFQCRFAQLIYMEPDKIHLGKYWCLGIVYQWYNKVDLVHHM